MKIDLYELYKTLNKKYFNDNLPKSSEIILEWSNRLTASAGICYRKPKNSIIRLSTHYHEDFPEEIENTLLHEMIHLKVKGHGTEFKEEIFRINSLGGNVKRFSKEDLLKKESTGYINVKNAAKNMRETVKFLN